LFACAGDFKVSYEGVLRDPPESWLTNLVSAHCNWKKCIDPSVLLASLKTDKLIKIPDVYKVEMRF